jgi:uncharacterized protein (DUF433 family)
MAMPHAKDFLEQFEEMPPDRQELLAMRMFEVVQFSIYPRYFSKHQAPDFPSVVSTPGVCGGSPRMVRTRIPVWLLHRMRQHEFSEAKILECYPTLTAGDLVQAWGYVAAHRAEIEEEIEENERD